MSVFCPQHITLPQILVRLSVVLPLLAGGCAELGPQASASSEELQFRSGAGTCGDGLLQAGEQCDDGNLQDDDGCDATCTPSGIAQVSTGDATTCAVTLAGNVKCWGRGEFGQLGQANTASVGDDELPSAVDFVSLGGAVTSVLTNGSQSFALRDSGEVVAWGANSDYELGLEHTENIGDDENPADTSVSSIVPLPGPAVQMAVGEGFACALLTSGNVRCWGRGDEGQLGHGDPEGPGVGAFASFPVEVHLEGTVVDIVAGTAHVCVLLEDGDVHCWGHNDRGQLGYGNTDSIGDDEPAGSVGAVSLGGPAQSLVAGAEHTCAMLEDGGVRCWGHNDRGQLGYGHALDVGDDELPSTQGLVDLGESAQALVASEQHSCALLDGGQVRCWGGNADGRLGYEHTNDVGDDETPASAPALDFGGENPVSLFAGPLSQHTCVVFDTAAVRCWGVDDQGQLGRGTTTPLHQTAPRPGTVPDVIIIEDPDL